MACWQTNNSDPSRRPSSKTDARQSGYDDHAGPAGVERTISGWTKNGTFMDALEKTDWPEQLGGQLRDAVQRLVDGFDPLRVLVFGSHARGDADSGSDVDFLILLPHLDNKPDVAVAIRKVLGGIGSPIDVIVYYSRGD
jgi:predicted nucleotidyltransferase